MASYESFNGLVSEFSEDLSSTFDDYESLAAYSGHLKKIISEDKSTPLPVTVFHSFVGKHGDKIERKDTSVFDVLDPVLAVVRQTSAVDFDLKRDYEMSDEDTKCAIWEYLQKLHEISASLFKSRELVSIEMDNMESIVKSFSLMDHSQAEALTNSVLSLVPSEIRALVEQKVLECQTQVESGELSEDAIFEQMKTAMGMFM